MNRLDGFRQQVQSRRPGCRAVGQQICQQGLGSQWHSRCCNRSVWLPLQALDPFHSINTFWAYVTVSCMPQALYQLQKRNQLGLGNINPRVCATLWVCN